MKQRKSTQSRGHLPCDSIGPEDGIDSRDLFRKSSRKKCHHKDHQLCRQVMETLNYVLAGCLGDSRLQHIMVDEVTPAPDASRLLVSVRLMFSQPDDDPNEILTALKGAYGLMRSEVASMVSRKKIPELVFKVISEQQVSHE